MNRQFSYLQDENEIDGIINGLKLFKFNATVPKLK